MVHFFEARFYWWIVCLIKVTFGQIHGTILKTRGDLANIKQREVESLLSYLDRFKRTYYEIKGINKDTVITCFKGRFQSRMLYIELQLRRLDIIEEMFSVAQKVALVEESAQEVQERGKKKITIDKGTHKDYSTFSSGKKNNKKFKEK